MRMSAGNLAITRIKACTPGAGRSRLEDRKPNFHVLYVCHSVEPGLLQTVSQDLIPWKFRPTSQSLTFKNRHLTGLLS